MKSQRDSMMAVLLSVTPVSTPRVKTALSVVHLSVATLCEYCINNFQHQTIDLKAHLIRRRMILMLI